MAKINTYATATPALDDKLLGTDISNTTNDVSGETNNFTVASLFATAFPSGLLSARPAAGNTGRLYYATDNDTLYRDNGSTWDVLEIDWNRVTSKPTTISGYGITDAAGITHSHASTDISDSTSAGRALLTATDEAAQRTALSLGTAATANTGTTGSNVLTRTGADSIYQPLDSDLTAIAALSTTSYGRALLALADAGALRTAAALGTMATLNTTQRQTQIVFRAAAATQTWTDMPAALTEWNNSQSARTRFDLTNYTEARMVVRMNVSGSTNAKVRVQYSTDESTWAYLDGSAGPSIGINGTGVFASSWVTLVVGARADVFLRPVGIDGDGSTDPGFANMFLEVR